MSKRVALACAAALVAGGVVISAQQAQQPVFRSSIDLVHLDVSVLDSNRKPVRGLTEKDFTVFEDGKPQQVMVFSAVDVPEPEPPKAEWIRNTNSDVQTNVIPQDAEGRLFVILIDDAMIPPIPGAKETAQSFARKFIDRLPPSDRVAVVFSQSGRNQNFTNDRKKLLASIETMQLGAARHTRGWETAVDPITPAESLNQLGPLGPMSDPDIGWRAAAMSTLRHVADTLIHAPQRRKALVYVSPGIPVDEISAATPLVPGLYQRAMEREANQQLLRDMPELFTRMQRANVTIYPVDPCGAGGFEAYVMNATSALPSMRAGSVDPTTEMARTLPTPLTDMISSNESPDPLIFSRTMAQLNFNFMDLLAKSTGGIALLNTNEYDTGLGRIFTENSSYYLLGYPAPGVRQPGSTHNIKVQVNIPGVTVRTRSGYTTEPAPKKGKPVPSPLDKAITGPVPTAAFPMRLSAAPFAVPKQTVPAVLMTVGLSQNHVLARTAFDVELQTNVYKPSGKPMITGLRHLARVVLVPSKRGEAPRYDLLTEITLPPGRYELRMSAWRRSDNVVSSLYADLEVPDFQKEELSVSGVMVEADPGDPVAPAAAFDRLVPVIPTSNRTFQREDRVMVFMRIYQGIEALLLPVTVNTKIVDERDRTVGEGKDRIEVNRFNVGGRAADYRFPIPTLNLPPGRYWLNFDISIGPTRTNRSVQFTIVDR